MVKSAPWWSKTRHDDRRSALLQRNRIVSGIRAFFESNAFVEVDCGALQVSPGNETHLHGFETRFQRLDGGTEALYLHTSPEFSAKKLLAAGEDRIFSLSHVFRNREGGPLNVPEFTMLEWYRTHVPYDQVMDDTVALLRRAAELSGCRQMNFGGRSADPFAAPVRLKVCDAFSTIASIDLEETISLSGAVDRQALAAQAKAEGFHVDPSDTWSDIFSRIISERIEPQLGVGAPTLLSEYPIEEAALARPMAGDPRFAERFELYVCGVELANGFGELTDAREQRRRFDAAMDEKDQRYGERYPLDESFLEALGSMPPAAGVALGLDRLVMLAVGARCVNDVIWTPFEEGGYERSD